MVGNGRPDPMDKPLRGAVLCCTSIPPEQRTQYAEIAVQMGAEHKLDLTSDVTHLLVGDSNTPKYRYVAREREDVKALKPEWVEAVRQSWMTAEKFDIAALEAEYRFPVFAGLSICVTGFEDLTFRAQLQETIVANGGEYRADLTKTVTHLIALVPQGKKYQYAEQWKIKVVGLKWLKDSLDRGMILEESLYHPTLPIPEQGKGAWNRQPRTQAQQVKRPRDEQAVQEGPRKLRRTASAKLGSQNDNLWGEIVGGGAAEDDQSRNVLRTSKSLPALKHTILEPESFIADDFDKFKPDKQNDKKAPHPQENDLPVHRGYFELKRFFVFGFASREKAILRDCLEKNGGTLSDSIAELNENAASAKSTPYVIVPYNLPRPEIPSLGHLDPIPEIATDMWVERCLAFKGFSNPRLYPVCRPAQTFPLEGFEALSINSTGFEGVELLHISKIIKLLGAKYDETLKPGISVLVCNGQKSHPDKPRFARSWSIPVVSVAWLWSCFETGKMQPFQPHEILPANDNELDVMKDARPERHGQQNSTAQDQTRKANYEDTFQHAIRQENVKSKDHVNLERRRVAEPEFAEANLDLRKTAQRSRRVEADLTPVTPDFEDSNRPVRSSSTIQPTPSEDLQPTAPLPTSTGKTDYVAPQVDVINGAIQELLSMNSKLRPAAPPVSDIPSKKKRLLGRALSNMSNSSREGSSIKPSRASSVDSVNTDGVGSVIGADVSQQGRTKSPSKEREGRFTGRANPREAVSKGASIELGDPGLYRDDFADEEPAPQMTQLGYAEHEDAIQLREKLVEKRRSGSRQIVEASTRNREEKKIKDDIALAGNGWGIGRRTRNREKSPKGMLDF